MKPKPRLVLPQVAQVKNSDDFTSIDNTLSTENTIFINVGWKSSLTRIKTTKYNQFQKECAS